MELLFAIVVVKRDYAGTSNRKIQNKSLTVERRAKEISQCLTVETEDSGRQGDSHVNCVNAGGLLVVAPDPIF